MPKTTERDVALLERGYVDRQFIMVADDEVVAHTRQELRKQDNGDEADHRKTIDWRKIALLIAAIAYPPARIAILGIAAYEAAKRAIEAWGRANQSLPVELVSKSEAKTIAFPPGHPQVDVLYIGHPAVADIYCPAAEFHRVVFEHKYSEAIRILMALGATRIELQHIRGWSKEFMGEMAVTLPQGSTSGKMQSGESQTRSLLLDAELVPSRKKPALPHGLVWYPSEPTWQTVAEGRINHGLRSYQLSVNYEDDFGVSAEMEAKVKKLDPMLKLGGELRLGGSWRDHQSTIWRLHAKFGEKAGWGGSVLKRLLGGQRSEVGGDIAS